MVEADRPDQRKRGWGFLFLVPMIRRLLMLTGVVLICFGYLMILNSSGISDDTDVQSVSQHALGGMALVICGGLLEIFLIVWRR